MVERTKRIKIGQAVKVQLHGEETDASVIDISYGGIRIKSDIKPEIGEKITIVEERAGELVGTVVRYTAGGFAVEFGEGEFSANFALQSITSDMMKDVPESNNGADDVVDEQE